MNIAPHWKLRTYMHEFRQGNEGKKGQYDARFPVLMTLFLHVNTRLRCWPSTETLCEETGFESQAVVEARKWLIKRKAVILVPYEKREGKERQLPKRQFVYQLTGIIETSEGPQPYLSMRDEIAEQVKEEVAALGEDKVLLDETLQDDEVLSDKTLTGEDEVLSGKILSDKTKALTRSKAFTNLEALEESPNGDSLDLDTANAASGPKPEWEPQFEIGQTVWVESEADRAYHECIVVRETKSMVLIRWTNGELTKEFRRAKGNVYHERPTASTLETVTPEQAAIGQYSFNIKPGEEFGLGTLKQINDVIGTMRGEMLNGTYPSVEELLAAYQRYLDEGVTPSADGFKVVKMVRALRNATSAVRSRPDLTPVRKYIHVEGCPDCTDGMIVDHENKTQQCPRCKAAAEREALPEVA